MPRTKMRCWSSLGFKCSAMVGPPYCAAAVCVPPPTHPPTHPPSAPGPGRAICQRGCPVLPVGVPAHHRADCTIATAGALFLLVCEVWCLWTRPRQLHSSWMMSRALCLNSRHGAPCTPRIAAGESSVDKLQRVSARGHASSENSHTHIKFYWYTSTPAPRRPRGQKFRFRHKDEGG